jgi:hypothetical protein
MASPLGLIRVEAGACWFASCVDYSVTGAAGDMPIE